MHDQRKMVFGLACTAVLAVVFLWLVFSGRSATPVVTGKKNEVKEVKTRRPDEKKIIEKTFVPPTVSTTSRRSSSGRVSPFSEAEEKEMIERTKETQKLLDVAATGWLTAMVNDTSLSEKTREKYKLKLNRNFVEGSNALGRKDFQMAQKSFFAVLKSEDSSDVTRYFAITNLKTIALKTGNMELFIEIARAEAKMVAQTDLSLLGIAKNDDQIEWVDNFEKLYRAKKDPSALEALVQARMAEDTESPREEIVAEILQEAQEYEDIFKELMNS